ncbi:hypothetical protein DFH07DRAFT_733844, partial [Mycena maculata]
TTMAILPPELIAHTIDFLHDDRDALLSCSLVSANWIHSCRYHLFSEIRLSYVPFWQRKYPGVTGLLSHLLYTLLVDVPHLAAYIHALQIVNDSPVTSWVNSEPSLPLLLSKLPTLRSLSLSYINWEILAEDRQNVLRASLAGPMLTAVDLNSCRFPSFLNLAILLSTSRRLKRLSLTGFIEPDDDVRADSIPELPLAPVTLEYLSLERGYFPSSLVAPHVAQFLDMTRLRTLVCRDNFAAVPLLFALAHTGTLERLELGGIPLSAGNAHVSSFRS